MRRALQDVIGCSARLVAWLPRGNTLDAASWRRRHVGLRVLLWAQIPALVGLESVTRQTEIHPIAVYLVPVAGLAAASQFGRFSRRAQSAAVTVGLLSSAALAIYLTDGLTEMHFVYFFYLVALSLYEDWIVFGIAIGFVVIQHAFGSAIGLGHVFHHAGSTWPWALMHGGFVLATAVVCVVSWHLSEQVRGDLLVAQRRAQEAQRLESLGLLAGGVAHDFNNLLVGVLGYAGLVKAQLSDDSPLHRYVEAIELAGTRATDLTKQMLAYGGRTKLERTRVDISQLARDMAQLVQAGLSKQIKLDLQLAERDTTVLGESGQLSQVIMNLITNAAESFGDEPGTVVVRTAATAADDELNGHHVLIEVTDSGAGMDAETQERLFEPFFTTKFTGRGLGLAAVSGVVHSHGGRIDVTSKLGDGSQFRVYLPGVEGEPAESHSTEDTNRDASRSYTGRVLVVDDDPTVREVVASALATVGLDVSSVEGGGAAVAQVRAAAPRYSLAIVDMTMPGMSGIETVRELRLLQPSLPIILSSGYSVDSVDRSNLHEVAFLHKPYTLAELVEQVGELIGPETMADRTREVALATG